MDAGELARYVVAHGFYARYTKLLRTLPKKKRARLRELRARLAAEEGRAVAAGEEIDDEDVALELERSLALLQDKYFTQCEATARALGLEHHQPLQAGDPPGAAGTEVQQVRPL